MTATAPSDVRPGPHGTEQDDSAALAGFGYRQELHRSMGRYASFAAGFSFISVLTTVFQFFAFGFSFGGAAFFWTWPAVLVGQLLVAACFAELAARYPLSGAIYQWSTRLSTPGFGWFAGWIMVIGQVVVVAAAALALQVVLPAIWSGFQLVGGDPAPTTPTGAANAAVLAVVLLALTTGVNLLDNRVMSAVNRIGVTAEIIGAALIVVLLLTHSERGAGVTLHTGGQGGAIGALLVGSFTAAYVLIGFDSAGELSEETHAPRRTAPRTILLALASAGALGGLLLLGGILAAPSLTDGRLATEGLSYVLTSSLGDGVGKALLADVVVAIAVATLAIQTAGSRMLFSMARDGVLPFSSRLAKVSPHGHAGRPLPRGGHRRGGTRPAQPRLAGGVPRDRHDVYRDALSRVRNGDGPDAGTKAAWRLGPKRRRAGRDGPPAVLTGPLGPADQHRGAGVRPVHDGEPGVATRVGVRPFGRTLVLPVVHGAVPDCQRWARSRLAVAEYKASARGDACSASPRTGSTLDYTLISSTFRRTCTS